MVAILEKREHNVDFHPMVDFVEASPLRYALTFKPIVYVSHIHQFWSTVRIETTEEGTKILATVDVADEPASPLRDVGQGEACPTDSGFIADQDRATIAKSSTLPHDSAPRVTSLAANEGKGSRNDAPIKGRNLDEGEAAAERASDDTEEMATILTSMDAATVLACRAAEVPTGSGSIPTAGPPTTEVPTGSDVVPTASLVFATATVVTPYRRRKGKEVMVESDTLKKQKVQEQIDAQDYHQYASELHIERRIELISDLVKYQDNYAKIYKFQGQQRKPWTKKRNRDYYMAVIRSNLGWKESAKKFKPSEEFTEEAKSLDEVPEEKIEEMMQLVSIEEVEDLNQLWRFMKETLSNRPPTSDKEMELWVELSRLYEPDDEDQLWTHTQNLMHAVVEWKLYDSCGVHHVTAKDKEIFMLVEKDYPLKKGIDFPLAKEVPTASEEGCHCQKKREANARKIALLSKSRRNCQSKLNDSFSKCLDRNETIANDEIQVNAIGLTYY
nr:hypothetical protein [Tanacetum cinerariifolium]